MSSKHIQSPNLGTQYSEAHFSEAPRDKPSLTGALLLSIFGLLSLLPGCATSPPVTAPVEEAQPIANESAAALMRRAANAPVDRAAAIYLQAAWAFLDSADDANAEVAFNTLEPGWLSQQDLPSYQLLNASLALRRGNLEEAHHIYAMLPLQVRQSDRALRLSSALCAAEGDYTCALQRLVRAAAGDPSNNAEIWRLLGAELTMAALEARADVPGTDDGSPDTLSEWRSLQQAVVAPFSVRQSQAAVISWLDAYPDHPAALLPPEPVSMLLASRLEKRRVALLLPLSGPLARAGEAVRDGFIAAALIADSAEWLTLKVYDAAAEPLPIIYERLLADGTDLIVGPLQKSTAMELNALNPELPVLVLNYLDPEASPAPGLNQFGLAIEDEAATIAQRLSDDGIERALLFHNYDDWSLRGRRTLTEESAATNHGVRLTVQPFTDMRTITEAVGTAMHVAGSKARKDELADILGVELEFLPRAREDVDAVVALIDNTEANALVPALRFHFADHLPVYASSQVARRARSGQLTELRGFHVSELPYFLSGDPVYTAMARPFNLAENPFASLIALGTDAFRLSERRPLSDQSGELILVGSTGLLKRQAEGRIARELAWGIVRNGAVRADTGTPAATGTIAGGGS